MHAKDPKQVIIDKLTNSDLQMKRVAKPESIFFLKEKQYQYVYAYVVRYISTTNEQWYVTNYLIQSTDDSFFYRSGIYCRAEDRFFANEGTQPHLIISAGGGKPAIQKTAQKEPIRGTVIQEKIEENVTKKTLRIGSQSKLYEPAGDVSGCRFLVGYLTANGQDVASIRMVPHMGSVEEDEVQDDTLLFLGEFSPPMTFEFYSPSRTLIATQSWDV